MLFREYLDNLPLLHTWNDGKTWNTGGFTREHLDQLHRFLVERLPPQPAILETGAGNSTITFLFLHPEKLTSIAPDPELFERIVGFCRGHGISAAALDARIDGSQWVLPHMASACRDTEPCLDFALIDGCHGWPTAFVDLEYINVMLRRGGYLMVDDVQLHAEKEMARLLAEHPAFAQELNLGKSRVFRKVMDARHLGEWMDQPYIVRRTKEHARHADPYALTDPSPVSEMARRVRRLSARVSRRLNALRSRVGLTP